jgi:bla regulator protein blaR1
VNLAYLSPLANHLWQSTLFAAVAGVLTLSLRNNRARVRYWVWLAASSKFLIPFSVLMSLGAHAHWRTSPQKPLNLPVVVVVDVSQPFTAASSAASSAPTPAANTIPVLLGAVWACGLLGIGCSWWIRWRRIRAAVGDGMPVPLELPVRTISSPVLLEPSVFGVFRPVLLLPENLLERLTPLQAEAILNHELCHIRHWDNLSAAIHMFVETAFWFHPLVWWIGRRMVEERERACDEEVLYLGSAPRNYADGILTVCKLYLESGLVCTSGITGANLKQRIEAIMSDRRALRLSRLKKAALAVTAIAAVVTPIMIGVYTPAVRAESSQVIALSTGQDEAKFDVASIKPSSTPYPLSLVKAFTRSSSHGTFRVPGVTLHLLIQFAYQAEDYQVVGEPGWANTERYDIEAKTEDNASFEQMRPMLRSLLAERFNLAVHKDTKELPVYELTAAKGGLKIAQANGASCVNLDPKEPPPPLGTKGCGGVRYGILPPAGNRRIEGFGVSMSKLAEVLADQLGRTVIDKTGFSGTFNFQLDVSAEDAASFPISPQSPISWTNLPAATIVAALQEQLGIKLQSVKSQVEVLVIDRVQKPSPN